MLDLHGAQLRLVWPHRQSPRSCLNVGHDLWTAVGDRGDAHACLGIAGIVLTIGMAVDANVLIFERIKEELKTAKGPGPGHRAWL